MIAQEDQELIDQFMAAKLPCLGDCTSYWFFAKMAKNRPQYQVVIDALTRRGLAEKKGTLTIDCDQIRSFVANKKNLQSMGLALDRQFWVLMSATLAATKRTGDGNLYRQ